MTRTNRKVRFTGLLLVAICLLSMPMPGQTARAGETFSFALKFVKQGVVPLPIKFINVGKQEVRFRKEPAWGNDRILRRALVIGPGKSDYIGMAFNLTRRTLQLDLNQDLDLTNDPGGIFKARWTNSAYFQISDVQLDIHRNGMDCPYLLDIIVSNGEVSFIVRSSYQGEIELHGEKWRMRVGDNLDGVIDRQDQFSISPLANRVEAGSERTAFDTMPAPKQLFLGGRQYQVGFTFACSENTPALIAGFSEINSPLLAELILDGDDIQRMVLKNEDAGLIVLDTPAKPISLPAGKYRVQSLVLQGSLPYTINARNVSQIAAFTLTAGAPYHLKAGGPLRSGATAVPSGSLLMLSYELKGMGGESYSIPNLSRSRPPKWTVYKGDHLLANGDFRFG